MRRTLFDKAMDEVAIDRLREFEPEALAMHPDGYCFMDSGGKDSSATEELLKQSGVAYTAEHNNTTADPAEVIYFIRSKKYVTIHNPPMSMWALIRKKGMAPRRSARFCCQELKERGGHGRFVVTGVRWGESLRRSKRQMVESCYRDKTKRYLHPIIDWTTADVWQFIKENGVRYCKLYDPPYNMKRVGCILCPMVRDISRQMELFPATCRAWERAVKATFDPDKGGNFANAQEYWEWWLDRDAPSRAGSDDPVLFEDNPEAVE